LTASILYYSMRKVLTTLKITCYINFSCKFIHGFQKKLIVVSSDRITIMMVVTMAYDSQFMLTKTMSQDHNTIMYFLKTDKSLVS